MPIIFIAIAVVIALGAGLFVYSTQTNTTDTTPPSEQAREIEAVESTELADTTDDSDGASNPEPSTPTNTDTATATNPQTEQTNQFNNGTYTATARYLTPRRTPHDVSVTLTVDNGTISSVDVLYDGDKNFANQHQQRFEQEISSQVEGAALEDVQASRVGGASLTTRAFNEAVAEIRASAQS